jgi:xanthine dehydrogenase accessory factor
LSGGDVEATSVYSEESVSEADTEVQAALSRGISGSIVTDERVISVFVAVPQMVVVGSGPVAEAVAALGRFVGWEPRLTTESAVASGLIAPLSGNDKVIIAAHDLELAGAALTAAIQSRCGYIGSVGSRKMQADRADWLAYRGVTDLTRVNGPAGLDIGADTPAEIAVSIVGEAIAVTRDA